MQVKSYKDLVVWQKALELVEMVYVVTSRFPREELYGLAEACSSFSWQKVIADTTAEFRHFLSIATC